MDKRIPFFSTAKKRAALLLAALFLLTACFSFPGAPALSETEGERGLLELAPVLSEGLSLTPLEGASLSAEGHGEGESFVFEETVLLGFTVTPEEGWSFCPDYSVFFPDDPRACITDNGDGSFSFTFEAAAGESVLLSEANGIRLNASAESLPRLYIDAELPFDEIGKTEWVGAAFRLELGSKHFESGEFEGAGSVKGRGNSSWTYPKKPYSIKLESKKSLLDIPKTKKYAIIPSYHDNSYLRNYLTYKSFENMLAVGYTPKCEFTEVYLNGEYNGIYLLVERVDIEKSKIDIEEADAEHITGGYLIEKDVWGKFDPEEDVWFNCPYWANPAEDYFTIKAPDPGGDQALQEAMTEYLEAFMQRVHDAIMNGEGDWRDYVDIPTWADMTVLQELVKNPDGNFKTSCYLYKLEDDDHLYMTAPWDFDFSYGQVTWSNAAPGHNDEVDCPPGHTASGLFTLNSSSPWFNKLYRDCPEFAETIRIYYTVYRREVIPGMFDMINEQAAYLSAAVEADTALWDRTFASGVRRLRLWLRNRIEWLDGEWLLEDGDCDMDGEVTILDALTALRLAMNITAGGPAALLADVDADGEVTVLDALILLRRAMLIS